MTEPIEELFTRKAVDISDSVGHPGEVPGDTERLEAAIVDVQRAAYNAGLQAAARGPRALELGAGTQGDPPPGSREDLDAHPWKGTPLPSLSDVLSLDNTIACPECGGFLFFDWGLKILDRAYKGVTPRFEGSASVNGIQVCAKCHHPIAVIGSDYYDARDFISSVAIECLIRDGQARAHRTPIAAMDP